MCGAMSAGRDVCRCGVVPDHITRRRTMTALRQRMTKDMTVRGFAENTKSSYLNSVTGLSPSLSGAAPSVFPPRKSRTTSSILHEQRGLSWRSCNCARHAIRFLYRITLGKPDPHFYLPGACARNPRLVRLATSATTIGLGFQTDVSAYWRRKRPEPWLFPVTRHGAAYEVRAGYAALARSRATHGPDRSLRALVTVPRPSAGSNRTAIGAETIQYRVGPLHLLQYTPHARNPRPLIEDPVAIGSPWCSTPGGLGHKRYRR